MVHSNWFPTFSKPWFNNLNFSRQVIVSFWKWKRRRNKSRLYFGHALLLSLKFKLSLNYSPLYALYTFEAICNIPHLLFNFRFLTFERQFFLVSLNIPFNFGSIVSTQSHPIILRVVSFFNTSGFVI